MEITNAVTSPIPEAITSKVYKIHFQKVEMTATEKSISVTLHQKITPQGL